MPDKTLTEVFTDIADAIREKTESQETITPLEMAGKIEEISTGYELESDKVYMTNEEGEPTQVYSYALEDGHCYTYHGDGLYGEYSTVLVVDDDESYYSVNWGKNWDGHFDRDKVYYLDDSSAINPASLGLGVIINNDEVIIDGIDHTGLYYIAYSNVFEAAGLSLNSGTIYTYEGGSTFTPYVPPVTPEVPGHSGMFWYEKDGDPAFSEQSVTDEKYYQYRDGTGLVSLNQGIYVSDSNGNTFNLPSDIDYNDGYLVHYDSSYNWVVETVSSQNYINKDGKTLLFDSSFDPNSYSNLLYDAGCGFNSEWFSDTDQILLFFPDGSKWAQSSHNTLPSYVGNSDTWTINDKTYKVTRLS